MKELRHTEVQANFEHCQIGKEKIIKRRKQKRASSSNFLYVGFWRNKDEGKGLRHAEAPAYFEYCQVGEEKTIKRRKQKSTFSSNFLYVGFWRGEDDCDCPARYKLKTEREEKRLMHAGAQANSEHCQVGREKTIKRRKQKRTSSSNSLYVGLSRSEDEEKGLRHAEAPAYFEYCQVRKEKKFKRRKQKRTPSSNSLNVGLWKGEDDSDRFVRQRNKSTMAARGGPGRVSNRVRDMSLYTGLGDPKKTYVTERFNKKTSHIGRSSSASASQVLKKKNSDSTLSFHCINMPQNATKYSSISDERRFGYFSINTSEKVFSTCRHAGLTKRRTIRAPWCSRLRLFLINTFQEQNLTCIYVVTI